MPTIEIETFIGAPIEVCFDLARSVEAHLETSRFTNERVVEPGRISGLLELGDTITFEGVHLGVRQRLSARIIAMDRPRSFVDEQTRGAFASLTHVHEFTAGLRGTVMRDSVTWRSPLGPLGHVADFLFLRRYMHTFLTRKQESLRVLAERGAT